ncbi:SRPBCC domain-containing protein [Facklamia sp. P13064]|uniref:SRPBCC domain-containing protein n=1 Tax=unclassified Facklamia TaxID=2622293 RepID=UPI003D1687A0
MTDNSNPKKCNCKNHASNHESQCQVNHSKSNSEHLCGCHHHAEHNYHHGCGCHHEQVENPQTDLGFSLFFEGEINATPEAVWNHLTDNEYLSKWKSDMRMIDCKPGGSFKVTRNGQAHHLMLTDVEEGHLLAYLWKNDDMVLTIDPGEKDTTLFTFEYWFADREEANAEDVAPWIINLYELEHFIVHNELMDTKDLPKALMAEVNNLIKEQKSRETL